MSEPRLVWDKRHGVTISQCVQCRYWLKQGRCEAFPYGVPLAILANEFDHTKKFSTEKYLFARRD